LTCAGLQAVRQLLASMPAAGGITFADFRRRFMLLPSSDLLVGPRPEPYPCL